MVDPHLAVVALELGHAVLGIAYDHAVPPHLVEVEAAEAGRRGGQLTILPPPRIHLELALEERTALAQGGIHVGGDEDLLVAGHLLRHGPSKLLPRPPEEGGLSAQG